MFKISCVSVFFVSDDACAERNASGDGGVCLCRLRTKKKRRRKKTTTTRIVAVLSLFSV
jgi:hypothetical protein